jgi:hypothetical protein
VTLLPCSNTIRTGWNERRWWKESLRNGWEYLEILRLLKAIGECANANIWKSSGKRRIEERVAVTKNERDAAVSIGFKRGDASLPAAP